MSGGQLSFKFSKSAPKRQLLTPNVESTSNGFPEANTEDPESDNEILSHVDDGKIELKNGTDRKAKEKETLVIPLITKNRWNLLDKIKKESNDGTKSQEESLDQKARKALLEEAESLGKEEEPESSKRTIPILFTNQVPAGYETDEKLDVTLRPTESEEADYDSVPIEDFGMAMLRGMGWKEGDPIGLTNKGKITAKIPELRPKGLGLGADKGLVQQVKNIQRGKPKENDKKDEKKLRVGACVKITLGTHRETYGKISSFDEDNSRVMVKLALGGNIATVSMFGIEWVEEKEYEREGKCINKAKYDRYKNEQEKSRSREHVSEEAPLEVPDNWSASTDSNKKRKRSKSLSPVTSKQKKKDPWLRPDLRVRIIDDSYAGGRYFKEKVRIIDVSSARLCLCRSDDGKMLDGITEDMLETVIPKQNSMLVMLLRGKYRGEVGTILEKNKRKMTASVQLIRRKEKILKSDFDDICQFDGDSSAYEEY